MVLPYDLTADTTNGLSEGDMSMLKMCLGHPAGTEQLIDGQLRITTETTLRKGPKPGATLAANNAEAYSATLLETLSPR